MERAENVARFIDVNLQMMLDLPSGSPEQWHPLVIISGDDAAFVEHFRASRENVINFLTFDTDNPTRLCPACGRPGRTPGLFANRFRPRCGSRSTLVI